MATDRHNVLAGRIYFGQPLAQAPGKGIDGLLRNTNPVILRPHHFDDLIPTVHAPRILIQELQ